MIQYVKLDVYYTPQLYNTQQYQQIETVGKTCKKKSASSVFILVITCENPGPIANGIQLGKDFTFNKTVIYHCNPGYLKDPPSAGPMKCEKDGTWNQTKPSCKGL